jgi:hypothetical protein
MNQKCPHCGADLPDAGDAFCPECRNSLDEVPAVHNPPGQDGSVSRSGGVPLLKILGWLFIVGAIASAGNPIGPKGLPEDLAHLCTLGVGIALLVVGYRRSSKANAVPAKEEAAPPN